MFYLLLEYRRAHIMLLLKALGAAARRPSRFNASAFFSEWRSLVASDCRTPVIGSSTSQPTICVEIARASMKARSSRCRTPASRNCTTMGERPLCSLKPILRANITSFRVSSILRSAPSFSRISCSEVVFWVKGIPHTNRSHRRSALSILSTSVTLNFSALFGCIRLISCTLGLQVLQICDKLRGIKLYKCDYNKSRKATIRAAHIHFCIMSI